jgi:hypothetical protein
LLFKSAFYAALRNDENKASLPVVRQASCHSLLIVGTNIISKTTCVGAKTRL